jgi:hypothetical protein
MPLSQEHEVLAEDQHILTFPSEREDSDNDADNKSSALRRLNVDLKQMFAFIDKSEGKTSSSEKGRS